MILRRPDGTVVQPSGPVWHGWPCYTLADMRQAVCPDRVWTRKWYALIGDPTRNEPIVDYYTWRKAMALERLWAWKARKEGKA